MPARAPWKIKFMSLCFMTAVPLWAMQPLEGVRVQSGDTLSQLLWKRMKSNPKLAQIATLYHARGLLHQTVQINPHIKNPDKIRPGTLVYLPDVLKPDPIVQQLERAVASVDSPDLERLVAPEMATNAPEVMKAQPATPSLFADHLRFHLETGAVLSNNQFEFISSGAIGRASHSGAFGFPRLNFGFEVRLSETFELTAQLEGFSDRYAAGGQKTFSAWQYRGDIGLLTRIESLPLSLGFHYEHLKFSYLVPGNVAGTFEGNDAVASQLSLSARYRYEPFSQIEAEFSGKIKFSWQADGSLNDQLSLNSRYAGLLFNARFHYLLTPYLQVGPGFFYEYLRLDWDQRGSFIGEQKFTARQLGWSLHVGFGF